LPEFTSISGARFTAGPKNDWRILESISAVLVAAIFVDFPKNKCNFLHKNKLDIVRGGSSSSQGGALLGFFFSWGSRHVHCPMKVDACAWTTQREAMPIIVAV